MAQLAEMQRDLLQLDLPAAHGEIGEERGHGKDGDTFLIAHAIGGLFDYCTAL